MLAPLTSFRVRSNPETMGMISRGDFELDLRPLFHANRRRIELILLGRDLDDLNVTGRCWQWPGRARDGAACKHEQCTRQQRSQKRFHGSAPLEAPAATNKGGRQSSFKARITLRRAINKIPRL